MNWWDFKLRHWWFSWVFKLRSELELFILCPGCENRGSHRILDSHWLCVYVLQAIILKMALIFFFLYFVMEHTQGQRCVCDT